MEPKKMVENLSILLNKTIHITKIIKQSRHEHILNNHELVSIFATTLQQGMMKWGHIESYDMPQQILSWMKNLQHPKV